MNDPQHYDNGQSRTLGEQAFPHPPPPPHSELEHNYEIPSSGSTVPQPLDPSYQQNQPPSSTTGPHMNVQTSTLQNVPPPVYDSSSTMIRPYPQGPPLPPRNPQHMTESLPVYNQATYAEPSISGQFLPPPQRIKQDFGDDDPSNPDHYIRDPHKLVVYLVPFPAPQVKGIDPTTVPSRFLIWTPPPPPLVKPPEGDKEQKLHKVQRKWQEEIRQAKTSDAKLASWKGVKSRATKGIDWAMSKTTTSNLDFLGRVADGDSSDHEKHEQAQKKTVGVEEMVLVYPSTITLTEEQMREEFVNTMLRTKTKAQRDTVIATGLMPVAYGVDILATLIWPFGGLGEIDTVWAYASFRGAKTSRSVTKRLATSPQPSSDAEQEKLHLRFTPSRRTELLRKYLQAECHKVDARYYPDFHAAPTESEIVEAIGWNPAHTGGAETNWEDDQWELREVKEDLKSTMHKAAKEWDKWCKRYVENPEKAMKK